MNQKQIDELKSVQEKLKQEGMNQFNDKTNSPEKIEEGLTKYSAARKMLYRIGDLQTELNNKSRIKK